MNTKQGSKALNLITRQHLHTPASFTLMWQLHIINYNQPMTDSMVFIWVLQKKNTQFFIQIIFNQNQLWLIYMQFPVLCVNLIGSLYCLCPKYDWVVKEWLLWYWFYETQPQFKTKSCHWPEDITFYLKWQRDVQVKRMQHLWHSVAEQ